MRVLRFKPPVKYGTKFQPSLRPSILSNPYVNAAYQAYKSPLGQKVSALAIAKAKNYAFSQAEKVFKTADGVTATSSNSLHAKRVGTPATYGAFGSVTRTKYIQGKYRVAKWIKHDGKTIDINNGAINVDVSTSFQGIGLTNVLNTQQLSRILLQISNLYSRTRGQVNAGRVYIASCTNELKITNSSNLGCTIDIYEIMPREDFQETSGTPSTVDGTPLIAWNYGLTLCEAPTGISGTAQVALASTTYGSVPYDSDVFTLNYVIKKVYKVELPASTTHVHESTYNVGRWMDYNSIESSGPLMSQKHFTKWQMIVVKPNPVHSSTDSDIVATGPMALDITQSSRAEFYGMPGATTIAGITNGFAVPATPQVYGTPTTEQTVVVD